MSAPQGLKETAKAYRERLKPAVKAAAVKAAPAIIKSALAVGAKAAGLRKSVSK
jgi:hypothetical protein